ncbi:hypothetical protein AwDysgo_10900 [Bacteroidales bacterium]|nr:hypothetical protein AwDysgo_10900 [Bacteroidales bacterium]
MKKNLLSFSLSLLCAITSLSAQNHFYVLDSIEGAAPHNISANGKYVAGSIGTKIGFLWDLKVPSFQIFSDGTNKNMTQANAITSEGVIAGTYRDPNFTIEVIDYEDGGDGTIRDLAITMAGIWKDGSWTSLGIGDAVLSDITSIEYGSFAHAISEDAKTVFGNLNLKSMVYPCSWSYNQDQSKWDYQAWDYPTLTAQGAKILGASADGSIACGWSVNQYGGRRPIVWTSPTEYKLIGLEEFGDEMLTGECNRVSANGKYIALRVGGRAAIYHTQEDSLEIISITHEGAVGSSMTAISNDGFAIGYSEFRTMTSGRWRKAFVYSNKLGFMDFNEFITTYAPDVEVPENISFNPDVLNFNVPIDITSDGKTMTGWSGVNEMNLNSWVLQFENAIVVLNRPLDFVATVSDRNTVLLKWAAPVGAIENTLTGYKIFRNEEFIANATIDQLQFTDEAPAGYHAYSILAVYEDGESAKTDPFEVTVIDTYQLPFFEDFNTGTYKTNYWTLDPNRSAYSKWVVNTMNPQGIEGFAISFGGDGGGDDYNESIISKPLDASSLDEVYLSYAFQRSSSNINVYQDTLYVEVQAGDDTDWICVNKHAADTQIQYWASDNIQLSGAGVAGKLFQIRFRVEGKNLSYNIWNLDNILVSADVQTCDGPTDIIGIKKEPAKAKLAWTNTRGVYELTYAQTHSKMAAGNEGTSFIAANAYSKTELEVYEGLFFSSISVYMNQQVELGEQTKIGLAIFNGETKTTQVIAEFTPNAWNTFVLDQALLIDALQDLKFGIEVLTHDAEEWPIGTDNGSENTTGKGNLYSEDGGSTWLRLDAAYMPVNWLIVGNLTATPSASLPARDEAVYGYNVYANGERVNEKTLFSTAYIHTSESDACYTVKAYYFDACESEASPEKCLSQETGINSINADNIKLYPNPASDYLSIDGEFTNATLVSVNGQIVLKSSKSTIPLQNVNAGIYFVKIETTEGLIVKKIVITK